MKKKEANEWKQNEIEITVKSKEINDSSFTIIINRKKLNILRDMKFLVFNILTKVC